MEGNTSKKDDISLLSWLELQKRLIEATVGTTVDDLNIIQTRKIEPNRAILSEEEKASTKTLSQSIVREFNNSIVKAISNLTELTTTLSDGLQQRFNLQDGWLQASSLQIPMPMPTFTPPASAATSSTSTSESSAAPAPSSVGDEVNREAESTVRLPSICKIEKGSSEETLMSTGEVPNNQIEDDHDDDVILLQGESDDDSGCAMDREIQVEAEAHRHPVPEPDSPIPFAITSVTGASGQSSERPNSRLSEPEDGNKSEAEAEATSSQQSQAQQEDANDEDSIVLVDKKGNVIENKKIRIPPPQPKFTRVDTDSDTDSDASGSTCIMPGKALSLPKVSIKIEPKSSGERISVSKPNNKDKGRLPSEIPASTSGSTFVSPSPRKKSKTDKVTVKTELKSPVESQNNEDMEANQNQSAPEAPVVLEAAINKTKKKDEDGQILIKKELLESSKRSGNETGNQSKARTDTNDDNTEDPWDQDEEFPPPPAPPPIISVATTKNNSNTSTSKIVKSNANEEDDGQDPSSPSLLDPFFDFEETATVLLQPVNPINATTKEESNGKNNENQTETNSVVNFTAGSSSSTSTANPKPSLTKPEGPKKGTKPNSHQKIKKVSRDELDAMRDVLGSDCESDLMSQASTLSPVKTPKGKAKPTVSKAGTSSTVPNPQDNEEGDITENLTAPTLPPQIKIWIDMDPQLKDNACKVVIERLSRNIEDSLNQSGYVELKNYRKMKKEIVSGKKSPMPSSDDDSSFDSDDSLQRLRDEVKKLQRSCIEKSEGHKKKQRQSQKSTGKKGTKKKRRHDYISSEDDTESDEEDERGDLDQEIGSRLRLLSKRPQEESSSGSEDLDFMEEEEGSSVKRNSNSKAVPGKKSGKQKHYVRTTISDSGSESDDMYAVLSSDDGTENKYATKKRKLDKFGSDQSIVTISSDSETDLQEKSDVESDESDFKMGRTRRKRRRLVKSDESDANNSDIQELPLPPVQEDQDDVMSLSSSSQQRGRRNIRKIMSTSELTQQTREAEKAEEVRRKRVAETEEMRRRKGRAAAEREDGRRRRMAEKQELFNGIDIIPETTRLQSLILEENPETGEPVIKVHRSIVNHLKPHQADGIRFMYNACFESIELIKKKEVPGGCILAHCMGLGKTLQSVALLHTLLTNEVLETKTALVMCPLGITNNWLQEAKQWTKDKDCPPIRVHKLFHSKSTQDRMDSLTRWRKNGGIGVLNYELFRRLVNPNGKPRGKLIESHRQVVEETLLDPGPDIVICDEGHVFKNSKSVLCLAVNSIKTRRRIILTGTPLQNNLIEYHTMMNFVKPNLLGSLPEFTNRFVNPIENGQHKDSTESDVKMMKRRAHVLHSKLEGCVQRLDYSILAPYLQSKYEYIINIKLSEKQEKLYKYYLQHQIDPNPDVKKKRLLPNYMELSKVWSHPLSLTMKRKIKPGSSGIKLPKPNGAHNGISNVGEEDGGINDLLNGVEPVISGPWWNAVYQSKNELEDDGISGKLVVLKEILKTSEMIGDKVLVFSQFLSSLDIIESFLKEWDHEEVIRLRSIPTTSGSFPTADGRWRLNKEYFRIDGKTKVLDRHRDCDNFNRSEYSKAKLFLISTKAGGLGINLYGANRVVIFDASWNPSQDMQSIFRVYRFGQDKPCYVYRLIARGTMEEKILRRQITKLSLASRVVDEHQIERHFKMDDILDMYRYDENVPSIDSQLLNVPKVPKDRLLADLLISHNNWIVSYEEFDSLLENKPDESLTPEDKLAAWEEYKSESRRNELERQQKQQREKERQKDRDAVNNVNGYVKKVKEMILQNHPKATPQQTSEALRACKQVFEQMQHWIHCQQNLPSGNNLNDEVIVPYINEMQDWLKKVVNPPSEQGQIPGHMPLTPPVPERPARLNHAFSTMELPIDNQVNPTPGSSLFVPPAYVPPQPLNLVNDVYNFRSSTPPGDLDLAVDLSDTDENM